jgi:hypothetical protein
MRSIAAAMSPTAEGGGVGTSEHEGGLARAGTARKARKSSRDRRDQRLTRILSSLQSLVQRSSRVLKRLDSSVGLERILGEDSHVV